MKRELLFLMAALILLLLIQPAACSWQISTVDVNVGGNTSLVIGTDGVQHISYYDFANQALKYAYYDGSWHATTVDTTPGSGLGATSIQLWNNHPCIAYPSTKGIKYAENLGTGWNNYVLDTQGSGTPSMIVMPDGNIVVSYYSLASGSLNFMVYYYSAQQWSTTKYIDTTPPTWVSTYVDYYQLATGDYSNPSPNIGFFYKTLNNDDCGVRAKMFEYSSYYDIFRHYIPETVDGPGANDIAPLSRVDKSVTYRKNTTTGHYEGGNQHLFTYTDNQHHLMFGDEVLPPHVLVADGVEQYAFYNSLVLDKFDMPSIVYTDPNTHELKYAWNDGFWHATTIDPSPTESPSLAFDLNGNPVISYFDINSRSLKVARSSDIYPPIPSSKSYEQYLTLIGDQDRGGGCGGYTVKHIVDIEKEMEAPYTPDISFEFINYIQNMAWVTADDPINPNGITDSRVTHDINMEGYKELINYGSPPETSYPTNYDILGMNWSDMHRVRPSDQVFYDEAQNYRIAASSYYTGMAVWPQSALTERLLALNGPVYCGNLFFNPGGEGHIVTLIGYDHTKQKFTLVDSANWLGKGPGIKEISYADYDRKMKEIRTSNVVIKNRPTPLLHPYTARINVSHPGGRKNLEVRIGAVGQTPLTVWNQNNKVNWSESIQSLVIDVPLPGYAQSHWPPSASNPWYVEVIDHGPDANIRATVNDITLVKRTFSGGSYSVETYKPNKLPWVVPAKGQVSIPVPTPAPSVSLVSPDTYNPGGILPIVVLTINGTNYFSGQDGTQVKLTKIGQTDIIAEDVTVDSSTHMYCILTIPPSTVGGRWNVVVTNPDGQTGSLSNGFNITAPAPIITGITPSNGGQGIAVDIVDLHGSNFIYGSTATSVKLTRNRTAPIIATNINVVSPNQITCSIQIPSGAETGQWNVVVTNPDGQSGILTDGFTVIAPSPSPTVTAITPNTGLSGASVKVTDLHGTNFITGSNPIIKLTRNRQVPIFATTVKVSSANTISCKLTLPPDAATGDWNVVVTNPDGKSGNLSNGFSISAPAPTVTGIIPNTGIQGTKSLDITDIEGANFRSGATVNFTTAGQSNISVTNITVVSSTKITGSITIQKWVATGAWNIVVTNPDGKSGNLPNGFTISVPPPPPSISAITPDRGLLGTSVKIDNLQGANFQSGATVNLSRVGQSNISARDITVINGNQITCTLPISPEEGTGTWNVIVTNPDGQSITFTNGFTTLAPHPIVTRITPNASLTDNTVTITNLNGNNFVPGAVVSLNKQGQSTISSQIVTVMSYSDIIATLPIPQDVLPGTWDVVVTNPDGQSGTLPGGFTLTSHPKPTITSLSPGSAYSGGSQFNLTVDGTNFVSNSYIQWNSENRLTTFISGTRLKAMIFTSDISSPGLVNVTVINPSPGGSSSNNVTFTIIAHNLNPLPGFVNPPTDPDSDGFYEDLNGNARKDFNDVVLMFNQMQWIAANEPLGAFDFNANGRIDFNDIVKLFGEI